MNSEKIKKILGDKAAVKRFAADNDLGVAAAEEILRRLLERPEVSDEVNDYIFSEERSEDFKGYVAGEEKGYKRGHDAGFIKGAFLGLIAGVGVAATYVVGKK